MKKLANLIGLMLYICRLIHAQQKSVTTHEGAFSSLLNLPPDLAYEYLTSFNIMEYFAGWKFCS